MKVCFNARQITAIASAVLLVALAIAFLPYTIDTGGLIVGMKYTCGNVYSREIVASGWSADICPAILCYELACIGITLCAALIALQSRGKVRQRYCLYVGLGIEAALYLCNLPGFSASFAAGVVTFLSFLFSGVLLLVVLLTGLGPSYSARPLKPMVQLNSAQVGALCASLLGAVLAVTMLPYHDDARLFGGTHYRTSEALACGAAQFCPAILHAEFLYIGLVLLAALTALGNSASRCQRACFILGCTVQVGLFAYPTGSQILMLDPQRAFNQLNATTAGILALIILFGMGRWWAKRILST